MGLILNYTEGQTPIDEEEKRGLLIPSVTTRLELDEFEQLSIERAVEWSIKIKLKQDEILSEQFVRKLHKRMFDGVWSWAGEFRKSNKNLGVDWQMIPVSLRQLLEDCRFWVNHRTFPDDEIAVRFGHRIVDIHCFPNGNGRHSRLISDIIISNIFGKPVFTWGRVDLAKQGLVRKRYIHAIQEADKGILGPLLEFARS